MVATCIYMHVTMYAHVEFLIPGALLLYCEARVRSSSVSEKCTGIVRLRIVFSKAALQKRGSMEPMESGPLNPPLISPLGPSRAYT